MVTIDGLAGREILDSRGRPTVEATCTLCGGATGAASAPAGMSTGEGEARELRDGDPRRYRGLGCRRAAAGIGGEMQAALAGRDFADQRELDEALIELDGTPAKERLGANAILATSLAFARAVAAADRAPLYRQLAGTIGSTPAAIPRPTINLFSGGLHAGGQVAIQDVLVVPASPDTIDGCLAMMFEIYQTAAGLTAREYGARPLTADEGGLAPPFPDAETMLAAAVDAIRAAGLQPGADAVLAIDVAASHFRADGRYELGGRTLDSPAMVDTVAGWVERFPIVSVEDGLAQDDWTHWPALLARLHDRALVVGDDLLCTNPARVRRAVDAGAANALLLKVNQIGTVTEAAEAARAARAAGWQITVSARSGETEDDWLADLAVGWGADQVKIGSITQSERLAKYNRLLQIQAETRLPLVAWPGRG